MNRRILLIILTAAVVVVAIFSLAIYGFGVNNKITATFNDIFPFLPAALVNGRVVFLDEADDRLWLHEQAVMHQSLIMSATGNQQQILEALIRQEIISDLLEKRNIGILSAELEEYYTHLKSNFTGDVGKEIVEVFHISEERFKVLIVRPDLQEKILKLEINSQASGDKGYERARKIKTLLNEGMSFVEAARFYSEDESSKYNGGDLGFFTRTEVNPWLKRAFDLTASSTSDVIVSPDGYHILMVTNKDEAGEEKIQLQHIFIRGPDFEEYLERQQKSYRIYTFVK